MKDCLRLIGLCCLFACVCVSHPGSKRFPTFTTFFAMTRVSQAGGSSPLMSLLPTKLLMSWEDIGADHSDVPAMFCGIHKPLLQSSFFVSMVVHDTPHKPFSVRIAAADCHFLLSAFGNIVQQYCFADSCTFPFHRHPSHRGN